MTMKKLTRSETAQFLREHDHYVILTHRRPDGDTVGSAAALCRILRRLGKDAHILRNPELPPRFSWLVEGLTVETAGEDACIVSTDVASPGMLPKSFLHLQDRVALRIDHHGSSTSFTEVELVDAESTEIIGAFTSSEDIGVQPFIAVWDSIENLESTGEILRLTFRAVKQKSYTGTEPLVQIECRECYDLKVNDVTCSIGAFETKLLIPGDINGDGIVNGKDLIILRQYVAEFDNIVLDEKMADVNADGVVSGKDVILMRQYMAEWDVILQ